MNEYLNLLLGTLKDPAPGLIFGKHKLANLPKRAYRSGHEAGPGADAEALSRLRSLCGSMPNGLDALVDLYTVHDGLKMYRMPERSSGETRYAVSLYPLAEWDEQTAIWTADDMAWAMEDCPLYKCGPWKVIGGFGSESMSIVMFFGGEFEGVDQAGRCYCLGLDGYLGYEEELAQSFEQLAVHLSGKLIVDTLNYVGFAGFVETEVIDGRSIGFGDVVKKYIPDVAGNRHLTE